MSNEIDITIAAQDKGAEQTLQKLQKENEKLAKQLEKVAEKSKKSSAESVKGLSKLNAELENMSQKSGVAAGKIETMGQKTKRAADGSVQGLSRLNHQLGRMGEQGLIATQKTSDGMSKTKAFTLSAVQSVASLATGYISLAGAVKLATYEIEKQNQIQENARLATLSPAQAILEAKLALEDDSTLTKAGLEDAVLKIAAETRAPATTVANTIQMASSALGDMKNENLLDATRRALQIDPGKPEQAPVLASSMLDLAKFSGAKDMRVSAGFLQNIGAASHVKNFEMIGQNLIPAINSLTAMGDTQERAGELVSTMTQLMNDSEGRIAATASVQLGEQLKSFFLAPEKKGRLKGQLVGKDEEGEFVVPAEQFAKFRKATSPSERIAVMQESPELRRAFAGQASFETKAKQFVYLMLQGDEKAKRALEAVQGKVFGTQTPADQALQAKRFEQEVAGYAQGKWQPILTAEQSVTSSLETARLADTRGQRFGSARSAFVKTMSDVNLAGIDWLEEKAYMNRLFIRRSGLGEDEDPELPELEALRQMKKGVSTQDAIKVQGTIEALEKQRASYQGNDPQMEQNNQLLQKQTQILGDIATSLKAGASAGGAQRFVPPAARVSRSFEN